MQFCYIRISFVPFNSFWMLYTKSHPLLSFSFKQCEKYSKKQKTNQIATYALYCSFNWLSLACTASAEDLCTSVRYEMIDFDNVVISWYAVLSSSVSVSNSCTKKNKKKSNEIIKQWGTKILSKRDRFDVFNLSKIEIRNQKVNVRLMN